MRFLFFLILFASFHCAAAPLKVLHLTFHKGCASEVEALAKKLSLALTTWYIPDLPPYFLDGYSTGSALYNIGHKRAERIWELHKKEFEQFDLIFTSDTAPLSRIFLQNQSKIPLIIWICDRFDYSDQSSLDCHFPDREYYSLFNKAKKLPHVVIVANTAFEHVYAKSKGVDSGSLIIKPSGFSEKREGWDNPSHPQRENTFYLPPYHNERIFIDLSGHLDRLGIPNFCGRHNGLGDLCIYKGIIHLPYSWSTIALFENMKIGIPYFIPSKAFLQKLRSQGNYWHQNGTFLFEKKLYELSEWYNEENKALFTYFDSWEDLLKQIQSCLYLEKRQAILEFAKRHQEKTLAKWQEVLNKLTPYCKH